MRTCRTCGNYLTLTLCAVLIDFNAWLCLPLLSLKFSFRFSLRFAWLSFVFAFCFLFLLQARLLPCLVLSRALLGFAFCCMRLALPRLVLPPYHLTLPHLSHHLTLRFLLSTLRRPRSWFRFLLSLVWVWVCSRSRHAVPSWATTPSYSSPRSSSGAAALWPGGCFSSLVLGTRL